MPSSRGKSVLARGRRRKVVAGVDKDVNITTAWIGVDSKAAKGTYLKGGEMATIPEAYAEVALGGSGPGGGSGYDPGGGGSPAVVMEMGLPATGTVRVKASVLAPVSVLVPAVPEVVPELVETALEPRAQQIRPVIDRKLTPIRSKQAAELPAWMAHLQHPGGYSSC